MSRRGSAAYSRCRRRLIGLIADKIPTGDWEDHLGDSESLFVNASTWGLMLTGRIVDVSATRWAPCVRGSRASRVASASRWPRSALRQAMRILGHQFVMGRNIDEALERTGGLEGACLSLFVRHARRIRTDVGRRREVSRNIARPSFRSARPRASNQDITARNSISVKLSALHPRHELAHRSG